MRFRPKLSGITIFYAALACVNVFVWIYSTHPMPMQGLNAVTWTALAVFQILNQVMIYWDTGSEALFERRLWQTTEVPWSEVTHVGALNPNKPSSNQIAIEYFRPGPMSERGHIVASPVDRQQFIDTLRRLAPQASFEV